MDSIIDKLTQNPVVLAVVVVLALLVVFAFIKRLIKFALFLAALLVLYFAYLILTGKEVPTTPQELKESVEQEVEGVKGAITKKVGDLGESVKEKAVETVEEKTGEILKGKP
ncbi:MAG: hypothetical protein V3U24_04510 [Candidatus Neomarinimicrobiota bacterium]